VGVFSLPLKFKLCRKYFHKIYIPQPQDTLAHIFNTLPPSLSPSPCIDLEDFGGFFSLFCAFY
jgi:hypothetical protein